MTAAEVESLRREVDRLRRELAYAIEAARCNGAERDDLAKRLGMEVATNQQLRETLRKAGLLH